MELQSFDNKNGGSVINKPCNLLHTASNVPTPLKILGLCLHIIL